jgi:hypothetical protein
MKDHRYANIQASHMAVTKQLCNIPECFPWLLQTPRNAGSTVLMQEVVLKEILISTRA